MDMHSPASILVTPFYTGLPMFAFRTPLIHHSTVSTRNWKHSSENLVHIDMIVSRSCCRFVDCISKIQISHSRWVLSHWVVYMPFD